MKPNTMSRFWCFTANNYQKTDIETRLEDLLENHKKSPQVSYLIYGYEVGKPKKACAVCKTPYIKGLDVDGTLCSCPPTDPMWIEIPGTPHLQGYIEFKSKKRFETVRGLLPGCNIQMRIATGEQAANYCKKDGKFKEFGKIEEPEPGKRNDLNEVKEMATTKGMKYVVANYNWQQIKVAEKFLEYCQKPRDFKPETFYLFGESGNGKTRIANSILALDPEDTYCKSEASKWFNGYSGQTTVILDDFRPSWMSFTDLITLLDRYQRQVETKGGFREFRAKRIIITSPEDPETTFKDCGENLTQIMRRIDKIFKVTKEGVELIPNWALDGIPLPNYEKQCDDIRKIMGWTNDHEKNSIGIQTGVDNIIPYKHLRGSESASLVNSAADSYPFGVWSYNDSTPELIQPELINFSMEKCDRGRGVIIDPRREKRKINNLKTSHINAEEFDAHTKEFLDSL